MKVETIGGKILAVTIVVCSLWTGTATGEMNTYAFDPNQSTVVRSFFTSDTYTLIGAFQLTVDANSGSFDWVSATFSDDPNLQTGDLGELFYMSELVGDVNDTIIEFELPPGHPVRQSYDIHITVTFQNDQVHLAGYRNPLMVGVPGYTLDAVANEVTMYDLTVTVVSGHGTVEPNSGSYFAGTVVTLTATPETGYVVRQWTGTDDDTSCAITNTVTMDSDKTVTVEFGPRNIIKVPVEYNTIQEAIDAAACGDTLIVAAGTYNGDINFNGKNIRVFSTNPDDPNIVALTVIQGTGAGPVVTFSGSESQSCVLDGFTITGGNTTGDGGGICGNGAEAMIANCVITNNHADGAGGGVSDCDGTITRCIIAGNTASGNGGGIYVVDCNISVEDCNINHNAAADGGGLYCLDSPGATITQCTISDNDANRRGGGIFVFSSPILIEDCRISRNYAAHGGGIFNEYGYLTLTNCVFIGNSADGNGGGMYNSSNPRLTNCTFSGNSAGYYGGIWNYPPPPGDGGASSVGGSSNIVNNCILWGNIDSRGMDESAQIGTFGIPLIINYSCVQGWTGSLGGVGNIGDNPLFVDVATGNYHLMAGSPCIDRGDNTAVPPSVLTDLDGNPRIVNGTVDMGAYEVTMYDLTVTVVSGHGTVEPNSGSYSAGTVVTLTAMPEAGYWLRQWTGTDDDTSCTLTNTVTMDSDKTVTVEFGPRNIIKVPLEYNTIQEAIDASACGDMVILSPGVHNGNINFNGKNIIVASTKPDDPMVVASTIIQGTGSGTVVTFSGSESQSCKLDGITITGGNTTGNGGGICGNGTEAMIANCIITGNHADGAGGGVSKCGKILGCTISGNTAGSAGGGLYGVISAVNCTISDNLTTQTNAYGGGIHCMDTELISGCTFINNSSRSGGGLATSYDLPTVVNCRFIGNSAHEGGGVYSDGFSPELIGCVFSGNTADDGGGLYAYEGFPRIVNCTFAQNYSPLGGGMNTPEGGPVVVNCVFWGNRAGEEIRDELAQLGVCAGNITVDHSCVQGWTGSLGGVGNIGDNPLFVDVATGNYHLMAGSPCIDRGDNTAVPPSVLTDLDGNPRIVNGTVDMGAYEFQGIQILYVDADAPQFGDGTSWATAFKYLQDALFKAVPPTEIKVAQGIYKPHLNTYSTAPPSRADTFQLRNGVVIKGGYAGLGQPDPDARDISLYETILSGDMNGDDEPNFVNNGDNSYNVLTGSGTNATAVLDGFTVTAGNADDERNWDDMCGAGMYNDHGSPTIMNCNFTGNYAGNDDGGGMGGAMFNFNNSNPTITNCRLVGNCAIALDGGEGYGGGICNWDSNSNLTGCTFIGNTSGHDGGGMCNYYGELVLVDCTFAGNLAREGGGGSYGGGMYNWGCDVVLINCIFSGNTARSSKIGSGGGGMHNHEYSNVAVTNCIFSGNSAQSGGGIHNYSGTSVEVTNCTFAGNSAINGNAVACDSRRQQIPNNLWTTNCILWDGGNETWNNDSSLITITYSDIHGGWAGAGNIDADPLFVDANGPDNIPGTEDDNLRLLHGSPCVDTGDNTAVPPSVITDLDGNPRIVNGTVDMGAYEFYLLYVDDDAPNDPGPGDPQVSDPLEDGTEDHPFDTIQEAVDLAVDGYTVLVRQGSYFEPGTGKSIDFLGKNITLTSTDPTDWDIVNNTVILGYVQFSGTEDPNCKFTGFRIRNIEGAIYGGNHTHATISHCNISGNGPCGATVIKDCDGIISNCLITDNTTFFKCGVFPVVFGCNGLIKNCTIANNDSGLNVGTATIENCIIYNNTGSQLGVGDSETLNISYCNLQGGLEGITGGGIVNWGPGNIDTDPCFVRLGYWIMDEMTLVEGDYHLRSEGWRWNTDSNSWTYDYITSRCIDAGNPASDLGGELMSVPRDPDNIWGVNLRINMGAFGGTSQAGMPPHGWALLPDLNNDGIVNYLDFAYQAQDWQATAPEQPGDQNRDGVVTKMDLARLAEDWLKITTFFIPEPDVPTGSLRVVILPSAVIDAGAQWRVDNGTWHDSSYTKTGLSAGPHMLEYKHIIGWITPPTETVQIELSQTTTRVGTYIPVDVIPPAPVPVILTIQAISPSSIMMTATEAFDESGVQYYFEATTVGGHDSGWLDEPNYTDVNLIPDTTYCYRVKARDKSVNYNETIWSPQVCTATPPPPDTLPPLPDPMQWDPVVDANGYDGRPLEVFLAPFGFNDYGATMRAIDADDVAPPGMLPNEVEYYFQCQDDSGFDSGWRTVAAYPNELERRTYTVKIGPSGLAYRFRVKARDASDNLNETGWSDWYPAVYRDPP